MMVSANRVLPLLIAAAAYGSRLGVIPRGQPPARPFPRVRSTPTLQALRQPIGLHEAPMLATAAQQGRPVGSRPVSTHQVTSVHEDVEAKLLDIFRRGLSTSDFSDAAYFGSDWSRLTEGNPSVSELLEFLGNYNPPPAELNISFLAGDWILEYTDLVPRVVRKVLRQYAEMAPTDLSETSSIRDNGTVETSIVISLRGGGKMLLTLYRQMWQLDHAPFFSVHDDDGDTTYAEVAYVSRDLLVLKRRLDFEEILPKMRSPAGLLSQPRSQTEVWRRVRPLSHESRSRAVHRSLWRLRFPELFRPPSVDADQSLAYRARQPWAERSALTTGISVLGMLCACVGILEQCRRSSVSKDVLDRSFQSRARAPLFASASWAGRPWGLVAGRPFACSLGANLVGRTPASIKNASIVATSALGDPSTGREGAGAEEQPSKSLPELAEVPLTPNIASSSVLGDRRTGREGAGSEEQSCEALPELAGVPLTSDFVAVGIVYFAQGALGLAALAKPFLLKDDLHLPPAEASLLLSLTYWPWTLKPLWGFIADSFPLFGSRRRAYLLAAGLLSAVGWLGLSTLALGSSKEAVVFLMTLGNFGIAFSDVVVDGLVVEKAQDQDELMGSLQSYCWGCRGVGAVMSSYLSGVLLEAYGSYAVFGLTALFPIMIVVSAALIKEDTARNSNLPESVASQQSSAHDTAVASPEPAGTGLQQLWDVVRSPEILPPVLFIAFWQMTPNAGSAMFYFQTNTLQFGPEFLGRTKLVGALATLAGVVLYNRVFAAAPIRSYLLWVNLAATAVGFLPLLLVTRLNTAIGIPDQAFVLGDDVVQTLAGELAHMPVLVLAAQLCPRGVEATFFALLMAVLNASSLVATAIGAWLTDLLHVTETDFTNLAQLIVICNITSLLPLCLLPFVPSRAKA